MHDGLVEREFEKRIVERALRDLADGIGGALVFDAPAGLGKTALIRHTREQAAERGFVVLSARGARTESGFDFGVVRQLIEPVLPAYGAERDRLFSGAAKAGEHLFSGWDVSGLGASSLGASGAGTTSPGAAAAGPCEAVRARPAILFNALYRLLINLCGSAALVVAVDDMQWVDEPSAHFLGFLARRLDSTAVVLAVAARSSRCRPDQGLDEILAVAEATVLRPGRLSRDGVAVLVRNELGSEADGEFCAACRTATGGNPLFLREMLRALAAHGVRPEASSTWVVRAAGHAAVRRHVLAGLSWPTPHPVREVARAVAVLGDGTDLAVIAGQCGRDLAAVAEAAELLVRDGVFEHDDPPAFAEEAVRDAVLSLIPPAEIAAQHARAARAATALGKPADPAAKHLIPSQPDRRAERGSSRTRCACPAADESVRLLIRALDSLDLLTLAPDGVAGVDPVDELNTVDGLDDAGEGGFGVLGSAELVFAVERLRRLLIRDRARLRCQATPAFASTPASVPTPTQAPGSISASALAPTPAQRSGPDGTGHAQSPPNPVPVGAAEFTPAESQVVGLAVTGMTNREIAGRLFLSEKTIEAHLSRVYRKVGVRSRTQLAALLAGSGR